MTKGEIAKSTLNAAKTARRPWRLLFAPKWV